MLFATMYFSWLVLAVKVRSAQTKASSSTEHFTMEMVMKQILAVMFRTARRRECSSAEHFPMKMMIEQVSALKAELFE